jgi:hypothetical protein
MWYHMGILNSHFLRVDLERRRVSHQGVINANDGSRVLPPSFQVQAPAETRPRTGLQSIIELNSD